MGTEFKKEDRYIVFNWADVEEFFTPDEQRQLARLAEVQRAGREEAGKPPMDCGVVEPHWPVWSR